MANTMRVLTVILDENLTESQLNRLMEVIGKLDGVAKVDTQAADSAEVASRVRSELRKKLFAALESD